MSIFDDDWRLGCLWCFKTELRLFKSWRKVWFTSSVLFYFLRIDIMTFLKRILKLNLSWIVYWFFFLFLVLLLLERWLLFVFQSQIKSTEYRIIFKVNKLSWIIIIKFFYWRFIKEWWIDIFNILPYWLVTFLAELRTFKSKWSWCL